MDKYKYIRLLEASICKENGLYRYDATFKNYLKRLEIKADIDFLKFLWHQRIQNITISRLNKYCDSYFKLLEDYKLQQIDQGTLDLIYLNVKNSSLSDISKLTYFKIVKQIIKYLELPIRLDHYKIKVNKKPKMKEDLLTEDEKHYIISSNINLEKKVFFTILFDTGLRVGEVFSISRDCFTKTEKGYFVTIKQSKTIIRTVFTYSHNHFIEKLLQSPWQKFTFSYEMSLKVLKRFEKKFNKRMYNHLARHTKVTELCSKLTEQEIKNYMGWTPDSKMFSEYSHLTNIDVVEKLQGMIIA